MPRQAAMGYDDDGEFFRGTLCFKDGGRELAFLEVRNKKLTSRVFWGLGISLAYLLIIIAMLFVGHRVFSMPELERTRVTVVATMSLLTITWMAACCSRFQNLIGAQGFELGTAVVAVIIMTLIPVQHPFYCAKLSGLDPEAVVVVPTSEHELLLYLDIWVTGCHFMLPLRWKMLLLVEVMCVPCYILPAALLGSGYDALGVVVNALCMTLLIVVAAVGKRDLEALERTSFVQVAQERVLRATAENKLHLARMEKRKVAENDNISLPETTHTGQIFGQLGEPSGTSVKEQLDRMVEIGNREHWMIQPADLRLKFNSILGAGGFGLVVAAEYYGAKVVAKVPSSGAEANQNTLAAMAQELRIFRRLHHPNIVLFYGACIDPESSSILLVLEYVRGAELGRAVRGPNLDRDTLIFRLQLVKDVCCAICYLHSQQPAIIHGDIKDRNVLVERQDTYSNAKLLDFGLSRLLTPRARQLGGTLRWMAPEIINKQKASLALSADIFSLGRLVYMVMTGEQPLLKASRSDLLADVERGICSSLEWPAHALLLKQTRKLVEACTTFEPSERPSIEQVQAMLRGWGERSFEFSSVITKVFPPEESNREGFAEIYNALSDGSTRSGSSSSDVRPSLRKGTENKPRDKGCSHDSIDIGLPLPCILEGEGSKEYLREQGADDAAADGNDQKDVARTADHFAL